MIYLFNLVILVFIVNFEFLQFMASAYKGMLKENADSPSLLGEDDADKYAVEHKIFKVRIDHFDKETDQEWAMNYVESKIFFKSGSPIFLFVGGNEPMPNQIIENSLMYTLAKETNGAMFCSEHRYYGDSKPHCDLKYLTSKQALADLYELIKYIKRDERYKDSKVVLLGGSYGGSLAVWMRALYPDTVDAVIASSPLLLAKVDYGEYFQNVADTFKEEVPGPCVKVIESTFNYYENLFKEDKIFELTKYEGICEGVDMTKKLNQQLFYLTKCLLLADSVEDSLADMYKTCSKVVSAHYHLVPPAINKIKPNKRSHKYKRQLSFESSADACYNYDFGFYVKQINETEDEDMKHWLYQCCNEFGFFQTSIIPKISEEFYIDICTQLFGPNHDKDTLEAEVLRTNMRYGGLSPNVTHVVFSVGSLDPWRNLSDIVQNKPIADTALFYINDESHCRDLYPEGRHDSDGLKNARQEERRLIKKWIGYSD